MINTHTKCPKCGAKLGFVITGCSTGYHKCVKCGYTKEYEADE